ncbi:MAG: YifB family Mg chelatase-like AAA ATPase, partial [Mariprofundus sp.]|nr:YifB family Mg chelatase-like AAA ATPase [Mariprofundus sp.]
DDVFLIGELALDGRLNSVRGVLPLVLFARDQGFTKVIVPIGNVVEAAAVQDMEIYPAEHLLAVAQHLGGSKMLRVADHVAELNDQPVCSEDMADIRGQMQARRVLEIAAAGAHHLLFTGSPGVGKSMLAHRLPGIMPPLTMQQALEVTRIYSVSGDTSRPAMSRQPPLRQPHHSASDVAIIGGGSNPKPGEISKADHGILFLDELPEHKRAVLETLRQPLEEGRVCIARAAESAEYPARFQLVAAMNPCPCGYLGHPTKPCKCSPSEVRRYTGRISGPLLDRFDLRVHVPPVEREELANMQPGEASCVIAERVQKARQRQYDRLGEGRVNARMTNVEIEQFARPDAESAKMLDQAMQHFSLSARSYHRILKVARTIADLDNSESVNSTHIAEALQYRGEE